MVNFERNWLMKYRITNIPAEEFFPVRPLSMLSVGRPAIILVVVWLL